MGKIPYPPPCVLGGGGGLRGFVYLKSASNFQFPILLPGEHFSDVGGWVGVVQGPKSTPPSPLFSKLRPAWSRYDH